MSSTELHYHLQDAVDCLAQYLTALENGDELHKKKASLLGYWIKDYVKFLKREDSFDPKALIRYKRGNIVKVHLGYRVGSEEGGLHYAVVMNVQNAQSSPVVTIVPLTSIKAGTDISNLHASNLFLGDEVFRLLQEKLTRTKETNTVQLKTVGAKLAEILGKFPTDDSPESKSLTESLNAEMNGLETQIKEIRGRLAVLDKVQNELQRMKVGSIALVGQITCVSKIRIYDPLYPSDVFANVRLSAESLDKLDAKLKELYTRKNDAK